MSLAQLRGEICVYAIFFLIALMWLAGADLSTGDDRWFAVHGGATSLTDFLIGRYQQWTSRVLIEGTLVVMVRGEPWVWRSLTAGFVVVVAVGVVQLTTSGGARNAFVGCLALSLIPLSILHSAGWVATSVNYLWVVGCGLVAFFPLKKALTGAGYRWWEYPVYTVAAVYASNQEQMAVVLAGAYLGGGVYAVYHQRWRGDLLWPLGIALFGILFALTAPGNYNRAAAEIAKLMPQFTELGVARKATLGVFSTLSYYFGAAHYNIVVLGLTGVVMIGVLARKRGLSASFVAALPVVWIVGIGLIARWASEGGKGNFLLKVIYNTRQAREVAYGSTTFVLVFGIFLALLGLLLWGIHRFFGPSRRALVAYGTLGLGFLSRAMIGFSPTLYASGGRTTLVCSVAITMVTVMVFAELLDTLERRSSRGWCYGAMGALVVFNLVVSI